MFEKRKNTRYENEIKKKYDKLRREKAEKLAQIKGKQVVEEEPSKKYTKSAGIAPKKISDRYKKLRKKRKY